MHWKMDHSFHYGSCAENDQTLWTVSTTGEETPEELALLEQEARTKNCATDSWRREDEQVRFDATPAGASPWVGARNATPPPDESAR